MRLSSVRSERTAERGRAKTQFQPLLRGQRLEVRSQHREQWLQRNAANVGADDAGVELGNVEQRPQQIVHGLQRALDLTHQLAALFAGLQVGQRRNGKMSGVERLQHVMACRRQEPRLRQVGALGIFLGGDQLGVGMLEPPQRGAQFLRACLDAALET